MEYVTYVGNSTLYTKYKTRVGANVMHVSTTSPNPVYEPRDNYPYDQRVLHAQSVEYAHRDHLGSIETITGELGNRLRQLAFEPFGSRKDSDWTQNIDATEKTNLLDDRVWFDTSRFPYLRPSLHFS